MSKIKAICIDEQQRRFMLNCGLSADLEVEHIESVIKSTFPECDYQHVTDEEKVMLLERSFERIENIKDSAKWTYYLVENKLYKSFWTNDLSYWKDEARDFKESERQLTIFDF